MIKQQLDNKLEFSTSRFSLHFIYYQQEVNGRIGYEIHTLGTEYRRLIRN